MENSQNKNHKIIKKQFNSEITKSISHIVDRGLNLANDIQLSDVSFENIKIRFRLSAEHEWLRDHYLEFSFDGSILVYATEKKGIFVWDMNTGQLKGVLHDQKDFVTCIDISKSGKYLVCGGNTGELNIWDLESMDHLHRRKIPTIQSEIDNHIQGVKINFDETRVMIVLDDRGLYYMIIGDGDIKTSSSLTNEMILGHSFNQNGSRLLTDTLDGLIWDISEMNDVKCISKMKSPGRLGKITGDGRYTLFLDWEDPLVIYPILVIKLYGTEDFKLHQKVFITLNGISGDKSVVDYKWSVFAYARPESESIIKLTQEKSQDTEKYHSQEWSSSCINLSNDGSIALIGCSDGDILFLNLFAKSCYVLNATKDEITSTALSPSKHLIAISNGEGKIIVWEY